VISDDESVESSFVTGIEHLVLASIVETFPRK